MKRGTNHTFAVCAYKESPYLKSSKFSMIIQVEAIKTGPCKTHKIRLGDSESIL